MGSPEDIYYHPESQFVADFIGDANFLTGTLAAQGDDCDVVDIKGTQVKVSKTDKKYMPYLTNDEVDATVTYAKGVLKVSDFVYEEDNNIDVELDAGNYRLFVTIGSTDYAANDGELCIREIDFEIAE